MATFVAIAPPTDGIGAPGITAWIPALTAIRYFTAASAAATLRARGTARVILLAATAAVIYGVLDAVTKRADDVSMGTVAGTEPEVRGAVLR